MALGGTERDPGVDVESLLDIGDRLEAVLPKYAEHMQPTRAAVIDPGVLKHQIPGGMASNMVSQLREAGAVDRLGEVLEEIPRTRADLGYPPLVTPMSQMVGAQAVTNVLFGRYVAVSEPVKEYVSGGYGKPVSELSDELVDKLREQGVTAPDDSPERPGDAIEPELDSAREAVADLTSDIDDVLIYALYPQTGERFLRIKHEVDPAPVEEDATPAPVAEPQPAADVPARSARARRFNVYVGDQFFEVDVDPVGGDIGGAPSYHPSTSSVRTGGAEREPDRRESQPAEGEVQVTAPMPGILVSLAVEVGQQVSAGEPLLVLEAMKMQNTIPAPSDGTVSSLPVAPGVQVTRNQVLAVIQT